MSSLVLFSGVGVGKSNNTEFLKNTKVRKIYDFIDLQDDDNNGKKAFASIVKIAIYYYSSRNVLI